jgi:hypothetical protein
VTVIGLAVLHKDEAVRSIAQDVAVTATIVGAILWARGREARRSDRVSSPDTATYISMNALLDPSPITVETPRQACVVPIRSRRESLSIIPDAIAGQLYRLGVTDARIGHRRA